jgi:hypothetical protein
VRCVGSTLPLKTVKKQKKVRDEAIVTLLVLGTFTEKRYRENEDKFRSSDRSSNIFERMSLKLDELEATMHARKLTVFWPLLCYEYLKYSQKYDEI